MLCSAPSQHLPFSVLRSSPHRSPRFPGPRSHEAPATVQGLTGQRRSRIRPDSPGADSEDRSLAAEKSRKRCHGGTGSETSGNRSKSSTPTKTNEGNRTPYLPYTIPTHQRLLLISTLYIHLHPKQLGFSSPSQRNTTALTPPPLPCTPPHAQHIITQPIMFPSAPPPKNVYPAHP